MQTTRLAGQYRPVEGQRSVVELEAEMHKEGIATRRIEIAEVKAGLHEKAEGIISRPIYLISRQKRLAGLPGGPSIAGTDGNSDRFIKIPCDGLYLPPEVKRIAEKVSGIADVAECAVFLSTRLADRHLGLLLAMRVDGTWLEAYRWTASWTELGLSRLDVCQF
jgi:hypothetical protein